MPLSDYTLNLCATEITDRTIQVRLHIGAPGNNGLANVVLGATVDVAAAGWTAASGGDSSNVAAIDYGVLSTSDTVVVSHYSVFAGNNFMGSESMATAVSVAANETFSINAGTVTFMGSTS